ncbi:hypothetical protein SLS60_008174 [Paraconiothyrium brasiliense]|uniref:Uncharacterized protein n=1 Tax=Paraconiothyrium brasiliense TaxID=300254 RepID=A0ABR3R0C0_9PLEO
MLFSPIIPYLDANGEDVASHPDDGRPPFHPSHFALAPDHYLITLIQYNTLRGIMTNLLLVQVTLDPACQNAVRIPLLHQLPQTPPPTFEQTPLQKRIKHEGWIDSIPCPKLRDNLIIATGSFNDDVLCDDICGGLYDGFDHVESRGLLVWGDPWLIASWEISPGFLSRWGFLLKGCEEMLRATNGWRESRGEEPLVM